MVLASRIEAWFLRRPGWHGRGGMEVGRLLIRPTEHVSRAREIDNGRRERAGQRQERRGMSINYLICQGGRTSRGAGPPPLCKVVFRWADLAIKVPY